MLVGECVGVEVGVEVDVGEAGADVGVSVGVGEGVSVGASVNVGVLVGDAETSAATPREKSTWLTSGPNDRRHVFTPEVSPGDRIPSLPRNDPEY